MSGHRLTPKAAEDLESIGDFIASDHPVRAVTFVDEIIAVFETITRQPLAYQRRDDLTDGLRQAVHGRYLILFTPADEGILIERVLHGARRLEDLL